MCIYIKRRWTYNSPLILIFLISRFCMDLQNIKPFLERNKRERCVDFLQDKSVINELKDRVPTSRPWMDNVQRGRETSILEN